MTGLLLAAAIAAGLAVNTVLAWHDRRQRQRRAARRTSATMNPPADLTSKEPAA